MTTPHGGAPPLAVCFRHADRPTALRCNRCGRPACPECLREAAVGFQCVTCVAEGRRSSPTAVNPVGGPVQQGPVVPVLTYGLIGVNVLVYLVSVVSPGGRPLDTTQSDLVVRFALFPYAVAGGRWWEVLTSGFLHFGLLHLAVNMFSLYVLGRELEGVLGRSRYLGVYLVSLLGGSASVLLAQDAGSLTAGASGAIFGLFGALAVVLLKLRRSLRPVVTIIGLNIVLSVAVPGISLLAHLGGLVAGALAAGAIAYAPRKRRALVQYSGIAAVGVLAVALCVVAALRIRTQYGL